MAGGNHILLINDNEMVSRYLKEKLNFGGYSVSCEFTAKQALETFRHANFDIIITKFGMPDSDGVNIIRELRKIDSDCVIIILIQDEGPQILKDISRLGVNDFITESISLEKLFFLVKKGIDLHTLMVANHKMIESLKEQNASLQKKNILLARRIEESTKNLTKLYDDLRSTYMRTIKVLAQVIDTRDHYTHRHSQNVAKYAVAIASELNLPASDMELIREACELHDLGKVGLEDYILGKPSSLTKEEWEQVKRHPSLAAQILEPMTFLNNVVEIIRQHHEHYDGSGYPEGLKGEEILLAARIIHLADAYEAMRSPRAYRKIPLLKEEAICEIKENSGTQFDPKVVEAFLKIVDKL